VLKIFDFLIFARKYLMFSQIYVYNEFYLEKEKFGSNDFKNKKFKNIEKIKVIEKYQNLFENYFNTIEKNTEILSKFLENNIMEIYNSKFEIKNIHSIIYNNIQGLKEIAKNKEIDEDLNN
jgi:hypothetical protein